MEPGVDFTIKVGVFDVPVLHQRAVALYDFSAGRKADDPGLYVFWLVVYKRMVTRKNDDVSWTIGNRIVRQKIGLPLIERIERFISDEKRAFGTTNIWDLEFERGENIAYIRAASVGEVQEWLAAMGDAEYVTVIRESQLQETRQ